MADKKIVLITGACGGLGYALAAKLLQSSVYHIWITGRSDEKGAAAVKNLSALNLPGSFEFLKLDVADDDSIHNAVQHVQDASGKIDYLDNNAGIAADENLSTRLQLRAEFETNVIGPAVLSQACLPLLRASKADPARIVNVSSGAGSITRRIAGASKSTAGTEAKIEGPRYRVSKAALNMVAACQTVDYTQFGIKVLTYCPGFTQSNLSSLNTAETGARPAADSAVWLADVLEGRRDHESSQFLHNSGTYEW